MANNLALTVRTSRQFDQDVIRRCAASSGKAIENPVERDLCGGIARRSRNSKGRQLKVGIAQAGPTNPALPLARFRTNPAG